ncbi:hypothetical protein CcrC1_gp278 [Caulobacter phage C1]|nr:hypothetical protein CcrC1_gp278 [Caulobacter phage C1]UTU08507.1 hypothetical protein CcrC2_gp279 [Caulobacter phage C2]UTU09022.1 hypothetical protein CcrJ4_gp273 [Caulobacter phage J4]UTU09583.1 hypothetical protein CcrBL47_gp297 [Caulobacter phage BL47]UTU10140.1 hypothetical protein CcrRB23_gp278 [Caulobacter phage RB23]WGN97174.1 hypothetical protein [Bertelyvirus sp.]
MKDHFSRIQPTTIQDAVDLIYSWMDEQDKLAAQSNAAYLHHGLMRHVRNEWQLWDTSTAIVRHAKSVYGIEHGDDVSGMIQGGLLAKIKGETFDYDAEARRYRDHWARYGGEDDGDPLLPPAALITPSSARPNVQEAPRKRGILSRLGDLFS